MKQCPEGTWGGGGVAGGRRGAGGAVNKASVADLVNKECKLKKLVQIPHLYNHSDNELKAK